MRDTTVAMSFAINRTIGSVSCSGVMAALTARITSGCSIHRPIKVTAMKAINSRFALPPFDLKVNDLLAKKLNTNAIEVERKLPAILSRPSATKRKSRPKSSAVLKPPTSAKRSFSACLRASCFIVSLFLSQVIVMILFNEIERTTLGLIKDTGDIFTNNTQRKELNASEEEDNGHK